MSARIVEMEVILTGRRAIFRDWGSPSRPKVERTIPPAKLSWFWSYPVLVENVTLRDLFALLGRLPDAELRKIECLAMSNIRPFLDEARTARGRKRGTLTRLEVTTLVSLDERWRRGRSVDTRTETLGRVEGKRERYALSLSPVAEVLDCEIHIDGRAKVTHERGSTREELGAYEYNLTLGEMLTSIFQELAFFGTPRQRKARAKDLALRVDELASGKVKGIPWRQAMAKLKRDQKGKRAAHR